MLAMFCDWAGVHSHYLLIGKAGGDSVFEADRTLLLSEGRSRSGMRASLSSLRSGLEADMSRYEEANRSSSAEQTHLLLREHISLRGFLPLSAKYEVGTFSL